MRHLTILLAVLLLLASAVSAEPYHMTLLTVGETSDGFVGGIADAYLEVKPGSGRIFLDSFPLTKLDTQISTRYANEIACDYLDMDCGRYDFFYTIRADSTIVGGPSASAPLAVMAIAALKGVELKNDTVMTGTINSGGSIGPVGGILEKAGAAQAAGFSTILVPDFAILESEGVNSSSEPVIRTIKVTTSSNTSNSSDVIDVNANESAGNASALSNLSINIVRVSNLDEAIPYFMDLEVAKGGEDIFVPPEYTETMQEVAVLLCDRALELKSSLVLNSSDINKTIDFEHKINATMGEGKYYSAASYCFNMGVTLRKEKLRQIGEKDHERIGAISIKALEAIRDMDARLEQKNITTLPELETYIIVKERVIEAEKIIIDGGENLSTDELAYAIERYYSGVFWSSFFRLPGKQIDLDDEHLEEACHKKISEAEERINYVNLYLPSVLSGSRADLDEAYGYSSSKNFKMCLFKASFAKAEANLLLSSIAVESDKISNLSLEKLSAAHKLISREEKRGFFPIMGYSYYEYALSLNRNNDSVSSLIFAEYSLELSNLEMYFPKAQAGFPRVNRELAVFGISVFLFRFFLGVLVLLFVLRKNAAPKEVRQRPRPRGKKKSRAK